VNFDPNYEYSPIEYSKPNMNIALVKGGAKFLGANHSIDFEGYNMFEDLKKDE
jgi:hypothetical protein